MSPPRQCRICNERPGRTGSALDAGQQRAGRRFDVLVAHQRFADEKGLDADLGEAATIGVPRDAAFGDDDLVGGNERLQPLADFQRGLEGLEVAVVDADQPAFEPQRALELELVVDLDQHIEAEIVRGLVERARGLVIDRGHDDEDRSPPQARASSTW